MLHALLFALACSVGYDSLAADPAKDYLPQVSDIFGRVPDQFKTYDVILRPDKNEADWWAGAPSVVRDTGTGVFWMACRMRTADGARGLRGYEIRILRSDDGIHFTKALSILREDVPIPGFERPAILQDPQTGKFKLYACGPWKEGPWGIIKFDDAESPDKFVPASARPVISIPERAYERDIAPNGYKDPVIIHASGAYHCYVIGYIRQNERIFHFASPDGEKWESVGNPCEAIMPLDNWHDFFVRPASVLPVGVGYLFVYEGSSIKWYDPVYNIGTGLGYSFDLHRVTDITPESPLLISSTPNEHFATFRYSHWMWVDQELWVYAEVACPDKSHEIRLYRVKR